MEAISLRDTYISPCKHRPAMPETSGLPATCGAVLGGPAASCASPSSAPLSMALSRALRCLRAACVACASRLATWACARHAWACEVHPHPRQHHVYVLRQALCAQNTILCMLPLQEPGGGGLPGRASGSTRPRGRLSGSRICYPARSAAQQGLQMLRRSAPQRAPWLLSSSSDPRPLVAARLWLALLRALCLHMHTHLRISTSWYLLDFSAILELRHVAAACTRSLLSSRENRVKLRRTC